MTLTQMKCVACRADAPIVTDTEIAEFHRQASDWEIVELDGIKRLRRVFSVDDFAQALDPVAMRGDGEVMTSGCKEHNLGGRPDLTASGKTKIDGGPLTWREPIGPLGISSAA